MAEIAKLDPEHPEPVFLRCRDVIKRGGIVIYPTDTFYGLGADPNNAAAVRRLFEIKGRETRRPILLLISEAEHVSEWAAEVNAEAARLMDRYWPGPLTLVLRARKDVQPLLTAGTGTIGLRLPGNEITRQLLAFLGTALTGTSANISGKQSPRSARDAAARMGDLVDLVLDAGRTPGGKPSTIVDVSGGPVRILRRGAIEIIGSGLSGGED